MKSWITNSEEMLGVSEKQAEKFSQEWYDPKRQETSALWAQRQDIRKGYEISMSKLRGRLQRQCKLRKPGRPKPNKPEVFKNVQKTTRELSGAREKNHTWILHYSVFVIDADASDERTTQRSG